MRLADEIKSHMRTQPVLVCFRDIDALDAFRATEYCRQLSVVLLDQRVPQSDRERLISIAMCGAGTVTLLTRDFGRGTNFMCCDDHVLRNGGVHVVQTFLSASLSEQIQIMGRTARLDHPGTFSMVLDSQTLPDFGVSASDVADIRAGSKRLYEYINQQRVQTFNANYPEKVKTVVASAAEHEASMEFIQHLTECHRSAASRTFCHNRIKQLNSCLSDNSNDLDDDASRARRTVILLDGTLSMALALNLTKLRLNVVFHRAFQVIAEHLGPDTGFQMLLGVYRNYNVDQDWKLFQATDFESSPTNLVRFLGDVRVAGGLGAEAVELGLAHVVRMNEVMPVGQVVIIGDVRGHTREESDIRRANRDRRLTLQRWPDAVYFDDVKQQLEDAGVRINTVYVPTDHDSPARRQGFHAMRTADGFQTDLQDLHQNLEESAAILTDSITRSILELLGRERGGTVAADMLAMYDRLYGRGHTS
jgi:flagellin-specific chaperone FliS